MAHFPRLVLAVFFLAASVTIRAEPATVAWEKDRLTVKAKGVPLRDLLREIGQKTGTPIDGLQYLEGNVSITLENATLPDALRKLVGDRNHAWSTMNVRAPGKSGIELQFPPPVTSAPPGGGIGTRPTPTNQVVEESWYGPDGKPKFEVTSRPRTTGDATPERIPVAVPPPTAPATK